MNPSYFRIKLNIDDAIDRLSKWNGKTCIERIETNYQNAVRVSYDKYDAGFRDSLFVYENDGWTVFEDLFGGYAFIEANSWVEFAEQDEMIYAGYNDAIIYAELIAIQDGKVVKYFLECDDCPEDNANEGDGIPDLENWVDVASFVDEDEYVYSSEGIVIIFSD